MSLINDAIRAELSALYLADDRHYHGIRHIEALLRLLAEYRSQFADPDAIEAAIWFHDAVYDSRAKDNEAQSAALAAEKLKGQVDAPRLGRIIKTIEATATHEVPAFEEATAKSDAALLLDMDLSILGAPADNFDAYEDAVRREYGWVRDTDWRAGRGAVLRNFLARPRIFHTDIFVDRFEAQARANIKRSLAKLGS
ncbi:putative metal-dependent HD superfamily phosphohydrolase [Aminobacter aminovorans]|uniref:Uncharacterized protein conserved in bacteria n=1 Tax=Aminobacter aminovorans TaxID=83263 RepID=A0A380WMU1_AMIAI|nr:hypothetical protein [Aminobacter aminovorans]TCS26079.1 putative metal-dependent HD superfamily phosphohydrolase [Aminobacter aminovorans]SUU90257.1 Uncharacterized protein conserved in bacteria [Aminobacter aminovorans]